MEGGLKEWRPEQACKYAPLFDPPAWSLKSLVRMFFGWPGYFAPWTLVYYLTCAVSHHYTTPALENCAVFELRWLAQLFARNQLLLWVFAGGWHSLLYWPLRANGTERKYNKSWPASSRKFLFGQQTYENVFISTTSGVFFWTAYEALYLHMCARGQVPGLYRHWLQCPGWSLLQLIFIPFWREFHFYWVHRMIHWGPLYRYVHYLHHKNVNPGPWSGLSMYPIEHLLYFSVLTPHLWIPGHPFHFFFNAQHTALTPAGSHHGFEGPVLNGKIPTGSYFHYLHHRYFECNYGEATIPLDRWFGTFRDGKAVTGTKTSSGGRSRDKGSDTLLVLSVGALVSVVPLMLWLHGFN